jgi:hypothetical protein
MPDLKTYYQSLPDADAKREFRDRAGLSIIRLSHITTGQRDVTTLAEACRICEASNSRIRLADLRPDLNFKGAA